MENSAKGLLECGSAGCTLYGSLRPRVEEESRRDSGSKPRVARNELPWVCGGVVGPTLKGFRQLFGSADCETAPQPFQGWLSLARLPRVARSSQPWAGGPNPFGIEDPRKVPSAGVPVHCSITPFHRQSRQ